MNPEVRRRLRRDCARLMAWVMVVTGVECLLRLAAPTVASLLLGDMADALLALDVAVIGARFPAFLAAILVTVFLAPGTALVKNLLLTRQGVAYDMFLMESTLRLPYKALHTVDAGEFLHRFEVDRTLYYCCVVRLLGCLPALAAYGVFWAGLMWKSGVSLWFGLCVVLLSGVSVAYDTRMAGRKAELGRRTAAYEGQRTQLELELLSLRDFSAGFGLQEFLVVRMRRWFEGYWREAGKAQCGQKALSQTLQLLGDYGVQVGCILVGGVLAAQGQLTLGALLGGYLLIPTVKQLWEGVRQTVEDIQSEKKFGDRMAYFYQEREPEEEKKGNEPLERLTLENVGFSYTPQDGPVLSHVSLTLTTKARVRLAGENGSGKSTLAALMGGIYPPDEGKILDENGAAVSLQRLRRSVALLEQNSMMFTGTVWENLFLPQSRREEAAQLLAELGFSKPLAHTVEGDGKNLSPGERKKVLLTRTLLKEACFVLLDEPLNHLDAPAREVLAKWLERDQRGLILISHEEWLGASTIWCR